MNNKDLIKKIFIFLACLAIPLGVGFLSYIIIKDNLGIYDDIITPIFAPPSITFSIVWPILYTLMGISTYLIVMKQKKIETSSICVYAVQLFFNFVWPIIFFISELFLLSSVWLLALLFFIIWMMVNFYIVSKPAAYLQIPYLLWTIFACVLNFSIFFLNM
ncbi:MAG: tryptophan-rich sensory protein [Clostridia bacterium]|nr:tryptophan-rich sensory protein [Clostridia bacterium]